MYSTQQVASQCEILHVEGYPWTGARIVSMSGIWLVPCVFVEEREEEREERLQVEERGGSLQGTKEWSEGGNGKEMTKVSQNCFSPFVVPMETWTHTHIDCCCCDYDENCSTQDLTHRMETTELGEENEKRGGSEK